MRRLNTNRQNLLREGVPDDHIVVTGNPVIDALQAISSLPAPAETTQLLNRLGVSQGQAGETSGKRLVLITAHRRENFGQPLEDICTGPAPPG